MPANLFTEQHLQRPDKLELIEELMWKNYHGEKNPSKKAGILQAIIGMQIYLSNYYGATTFVLSKRIKTDYVNSDSSEISQLLNQRLKEKKQEGQQLQEFSLQEQKELRDMTPLS